MRLRSKGVDDTRAIGEALGRQLRAGDVLVLAGNLGSGKTALVQGLARGLDIDVRVTSPSFVIVREYEGRLPLHHVDVYRLDHFQELHDLGFEEVLTPHGVTAIEWGDRVTPMLPDDRLDVSLRRAADGDAELRIIDVSPVGSTWRSRYEDLAEVLGTWDEGA